MRKLSCPSGNSGKKAKTAAWRVLLGYLNLWDRGDECSTVKYGSVPIGILNIIAICIVCLSAKDSAFSTVRSLEKDMLRS